MENTLVGQISEDHLISRFFAPYVQDTHDDSALVEPPQGHQLLVSSDLLTEHIHFMRAWPAEGVGLKAALANVSDIAAGGGRPLWATLSLALPRDLPLSWLADFSRGFSHGLSLGGASWVGGDTTRSHGPVTLSVTIIGAVPWGCRVARNGARPGDHLLVSGPLGGAAAGLARLLQSGASPDSRDPLVWRHFLPPVRVDFAHKLACRQLLSAMMDLSDGLATDLPRMCQASKCGAEVWVDRLPLAPGLASDPNAQLNALSAGEDFELLMAVRDENLPHVEAIAEEMGMTPERIGKIVSGSRVRYFAEGGQLRPPDGWRHFA